VRHLVVIAGNAFLLLGFISTSSLQAQDLGKPTVTPKGGTLTEVNTTTLKPLAGEVRYLAPIHGIRQIPATGYNYKKHIEEMRFLLRPSQRFFSNRCYR